MIQENIIGFELSKKGTDTISGINPAKLEDLPGEFAVATKAEVDEALQKALAAWRLYRNFSGQQKATFLCAIADEIEALGDELVRRAMAETGLPEGRIIGERGRTCGQLRLFAQLVEEGSWVEATIDKAQPDRTPAPKPDVRRMLTAIGPVVVFTASNFPLAFSTAGGDTASALAAGCPVIVKAHESHPGTNALVAGAIQRAAKATNMPDGVFSSLNGRGYWLGETLVQHPLTKAVAFTGSHRGGKALYDLANKREEPIPVFAEMGSVNPIFLLPAKVKNSYDDLAVQIANSVNLGAGQFCTNPGLLIALDNEDTTKLAGALRGVFSNLPQATMLNPGIHKNFASGKAEMLSNEGVETEFAASEEAGNGKLKAPPTVASVSARAFLENPKMQDEVFGPFSLLIKCVDQAEMERVAEALQGQLTATIVGETSEIAAAPALLELLREKVGRLLFNGVPTGVEVCHAMQHGGPYPATTDSRFTSVGTSAIKRFARPISFQNMPHDLLPEALQDGNPLGIWRTIDGEFVR